MDTYIAELKTEIVEVKTLVKGTNAHLESISKWLGEHETRDREDFKEVHTRVSRVERKQNWLLGVGSTCLAFGSAVLAWLRLTPPPT